MNLKKLNPRPYAAQERSALDVLGWGEESEFGMPYR